MRDIFPFSLIRRKIYSVANFHVDYDKPDQNTDRMINKEIW